MDVLLHPTYLPNIATFATLFQNTIIWEVCDNYQKQTYRNRAFICTDQGKFMLNIPIKHVGGKEGRQKYKEVRLDNDYRWQRQHWRTLQTAYRTSPFFEYYEDDLAPIFVNKYQYLLDFNLKTIDIIGNCLQFKVNKRYTDHYELNPQGVFDARFLVNAKKTIDINQKSYTQVFNTRHGFIENCSVLDLLFNEGPASLDYLMNQNLDFLNA
ncbi:WbqC family protein [uncultured Eudoraea sp.]|uniref:WbqC family protein n=1 Tax=uncultured Eudoraea sp. TaxID=1035614 RepID=UPI002603E18E|nr:WbqC family protein [uncultured Eudoraea sp.]